MILSCLLTCNEARRISREKLARLLGQNPSVGFHHESIVHKEEKLKEDAKVQTAKGVMFSSLDDVAKHLQSLGVKIDAPKDSEMSEVLNKYGVLKSSKTTDNDSKVESLHSENKDDQETSNTFGTSIEKQKESIDNPPMFHQEKMMISPKGELKFAG